MSKLDIGMSQDLFDYLSKTVGPITRGFLIPIGFRPILEPLKNDDKVKFIVVEFMKDFKYDLKICDDTVIEHTSGRNTVITYVLQIEDRINEVANYVFNNLYSVLNPLKNNYDRIAFSYRGIRYNNVEHFSRVKGMTYRFARRWLIENNVIKNVPRKYVKKPFKFNGIVFKSIRECARHFKVSESTFRYKLKTNKLTITILE